MGDPANIVVTTVAIGIAVAISWSTFESLRMMLKKIATALISFVRSGLMGFLPIWIIGAIYVPFFILFLKGNVVKFR